TVSSSPSITGLSTLAANKRFQQLGFGRCLMRRLSLFLSRFASLTTTYTRHGATKNIGMFTMLPPGR
ncbi:MAG: hypothetical protein LBU46_04060, partial [Candidatus Accumulibacter sp.]|nr:hypothetical protein [Accumulibacter sp.]